MMIDLTIFLIFITAVSSGSIVRRLQTTFVPCSSNCPSTGAEICTWIETCGIGCYCGIPPVASRSPTGPAPIILFPTMFAVPSPAPVPATPTTVRFPAKTWAPTRSRSPTPRTPTLRPTIRGPTRIPVTAAPNGGYFACNTNCPATDVPKCTWLEDCGNGCYCGTLPVASLTPTGPAPVIRWPTMFAGPSPRPVPVMPTAPPANAIPTNVFQGVPTMIPLTPTLVMPTASSFTGFPIKANPVFPTQRPLLPTTILPTPPTPTSKPVASQVGKPTAKPSTVALSVVPTLAVPTTARPTNPTAPPTPRPSPTPTARLSPTPTTAPTYTLTATSSGKGSSNNQQNNQGISNGNGSSKQLSTGMLAGIVVVSLFVVFLIIGVLYYKNQESSEAHKIDLHQFYERNTHANEIRAPEFIAYVNGDTRRNSRGTSGSRESISSRSSIGSVREGSFAGPGYDRRDSIPGIVEEPGGFHRNLSPFDGRASVGRNDLPRRPSLSRGPTLGDRPSLDQMRPRDRNSASGGLTRLSFNTGLPPRLSVEGQQMQGSSYGHQYGL